MDKEYKHILPRPNAAQTEDGSASRQTEPVKRRRSSTIIACNSCRTKKTGCDGNRPTCIACLRRGTTCVYISASPQETPAMAMRREIETLKRERGKLQELFDMLRTIPEAKSFDILQKLRLTTANITSLLSNDDSLLDQASPQQAPRRLPARGSVEFKLMVRHAFAYPALAPLDASALGSASILTTDIVITAASKLISRITPPPTICPSPKSPISETFLEQSPSINAQAYYDARLDLLNISFWSDVQISNRLAATLLSLYLDTDHPTLGFFDSDLFLTDLTDNRVRYCSQLLVSSVLAWACQSYSTFDPDIVSTGDAFFEEANNLWQLGQVSDSLPTIAAAQLLSLRSIYNGSSDGLSYLKPGIGMAQRMGFFGMADFTARVEPFAEPDFWVNACSYTAWGAFNWTSMRSFMFQEGEPALLFPPKVSPPGSGSHRRHNETPADDVNILSNSNLLGKTFPAMCEFWALTSEWTSVYYVPGEVPILERVSVGFANRAFQKLLAWSDRLHIMLARGEQSSHHSFIFHMWFHASILQIYRPFTGDQIPGILKLDSDYAKDIFVASLNQLKHLVVVFRHTFPCASYTVHWHIALLHIANSALQDTTDPQWRAYFMLSLNSYAELFASFRVSKRIAKSLLSIGLRLGVLQTAEALALLNRIHSDTIHHANLENISASFVIDMDLAVVDRQAAQLDILSNTFDDLTLFGELIASE